MTEQNLELRIENDWKAAFKAGNIEKKNVLSSIRAELKNWKIDNKSKDSIVDDNAELVLRKMVKQLGDALSQSSSRPDVVSKLNYEISTISEYLPAQMTEEEIDKEIDAAFLALNPQGQKETGKIIGFLMKNLKGRADGKLIKSMVDQRFT